MRTGIAFAGLLLFAVALAIGAPATLIDPRLEALSGGRLRLVDARGTIWNGNGMLWLPPGFVSPRLKWHIDPWPLLGGELRGSVTAEDGAQPHALFSVGGEDFAVRDVALSIPAGALLQVARTPEPWASAGGTIALHSDLLTWRHEALDGTLTARWDGASLSVPMTQGRLALGDVRLDAVGKDGALVGSLANAGGDVDISGKGRLASAAMRIELTIRPRDGIDIERSRAITGALALLGQPDAQNAYRVTWTATLR